MKKWEEAENPRQPNRVGAEMKTIQKHEKNYNPLGLSSYFEWNESPNQS
jgi:hypothetical protein